MTTPTNPHEPRMHRTHTVAKPCGCAKPGDGKAHFVCSYCGAMYDRQEVWTFPLWTCYDCGAGYVSESRRYQKRGAEEKT